MPAPNSYGQPPGSEIDYVEATSSLVVTATTEGASQTFITGNPVYFDGTRIKLEFWIANASILNGTGVISIFQDGATIGWIDEFSDDSGSVTVGLPLKGETIFSPAVGFHTYTIRAWKTGGTMNLTAKTRATKQELPSFMRITKC